MNFMFSTRLSKKTPVKRQKRVEKDEQSSFLLRNKVLEMSIRPSGNYQELSSQDNGLAKCLNRFTTLFIVEKFCAESFSQSATKKAKRKQGDSSQVVV